MKPFTYRRAFADATSLHQLGRDLKGLSTPAARWPLQALDLGYGDPEGGTIDAIHTGIGAFIRAPHPREGHPREEMLGRIEGLGVCNPDYS